MLRRRSLTPNHSVLFDLHFVVKDEEAMEFSALAKAFSSSDEVCRCILKSDFLKVREVTRV